MKNKLIQRLFKEGLITTVIGLLIITVAVLAWIVFEKSASESAIIATIGTPLLFLKDEHVGLKKKDNGET